jgi:hypothetical protein
MCTNINLKRRVSGQNGCTGTKEQGTGTESELDQANLVYMANAEFEHGYKMGMAGIAAERANNTNQTTWRGGSDAGQDEYGGGRKKAVSCGFTAKWRRKELNQRSGLSRQV